LQISTHFSLYTNIIMVKKATTVKERNEQQQKNAHPISSRLKTKAPTATKANENTNMMRTPYACLLI
jgi:hypothetical protein